MENYDIEKLSSEISKIADFEIERVRDLVHQESKNRGILVKREWEKKLPQTSGEIEDFYRNSEAYIYDLYIEASRNIRKEWRNETLKEMIRVRSYGNILDFGGGVGEDSLYFAENGFNVEFYDLDGKVKGFAKKNFTKKNANIKLLEERFWETKDQLSKGIYKNIVSFEVLEHLENPIKYLRLFFDLLEVGGHLFVTESFDLVNAEYPSHLEQNLKYKDIFIDEATKIGFTYLGKYCDNRIYHFAKYSNTSFIIPFYNGKDYLKKLIPSIREYTKYVPYNLIFIDDHGGDVETAEYVQSSLLEHDILISNKNNLGFVRSTNLGLSSVKKGDNVLLLNTDTEILHNNWLHELLRTAYENNENGIVNPISNSSSIFSIREIFSKDLLETKVDIENYLSKCNRRILQIPTAVGFCMLIREDVFRYCGLLNEVFGMGYGEENEYCMRARTFGYKCLLTSVSVVYHKGNASMITHPNIKLEGGAVIKNERILEKLYPEYKNLVTDSRFLYNLEVYKKRIKLDFQLSLIHDKQSVLMLTHEPVDGTTKGGTELHVMDLINGFRQQVPILVLNIKYSRANIEIFYKNISNKLSIPINSVTKKDLFFDEELRQIYSDILKHYNVGFIHIHHLLNHTFDIYEIAKIFEVPIVETLHDYYHISRNYILEECIDKDTLESKIELPRILEYVDEKTNIVPASWLEMSKRYLKSCKILISPSIKTKNIFEKILNINNIQVIYHGQTFDELEYTKRTGENSLITITNNNTKVLLLGGVHQFQKGKTIIEELVESTKGLNIEYHFLGTEATYWKFENKQAIFHGFYDRSDVIRKIREISPDVGLMLSVYEETFCYTLSEMWSSKIPVIILNRGAGKERLEKETKGYGGIILESQTKENIIKEIILILKNSKKIEELKNKFIYEGRSLDEMYKEYEFVYSNLTSNGRSHVLDNDFIHQCQENYIKIDYLGGQVHILSQEKNKSAELINIRQQIRRYIPFRIRQKIKYVLWKIRKVTA